MHRFIRLAYLTPVILLLAACGSSQAAGKGASAPLSNPSSVAEAVTTAPTAPSATARPTVRPATATPTPTATPTAAAEATRSADGAANLPALTALNALPLPGAGSDEANSPARPTRIVIPAIGLDLKPVAVGLDASHVPIVPKHDVGWFTAGAAPGEGGNVVFWGHVLRWLDSPEVPAPFERLHELQPGAEVTLISADGQQRHYHVTQQLRVQPQDTRYLFPTLGEHVTLVSCIGDKVIERGVLTKKFRLVTIAEPTR